MDGQRILKLLPQTSCAVSRIGVEISSPPGTVTGEGETPSHPAKDNSGLSGKEKSGATGEEETPIHRFGGNSGPPGIGQTLGPLVSGKAWCHPARGEPARGNFGPPAQGKLQGMWRRGDPESRNEKKALSHPAKGNLEPFGLGATPVIWLQESSEPLAEEVLGATRLGGNPGLLAKRTILQPWRGEPRATR